jgi:WD40 repeat protein
MTSRACHAGLVRLALVCVVMSATASAAPAPGQPRMQAFLGAPGIALGGNVAAATFCDTWRRGILRLDDGKLVALDADGAITQLGSAGSVPNNAAMVCDRKNQIWIGTGKQLAIIAPGKQPRIEPLALVSDIRALRVLDDDTIGIVDLRGVVYRFGTVLEQRWAAPNNRKPGELDGTGEHGLDVIAGRIEIVSASGTQPGPQALSAIWLDNTTVLFGDRTGKLQRWTITAPIDQTRVVAQVPTRGVNVFVRPVFHHAGAKRIIVSRGNEGPLLVLGFDAQGELASTLSSRMPAGRRSIASGESTFAVVTTNDRAFIIGDITKPSFVIDREHPLANVDSMTFSPDGRSLAILGGDRDVLVFSLDHRTTPRRLEATAPFVRPPLRWFADGTLTAGNFGIHMRWNPDGTFEERRDRSIGFTDLGNPITFDNRTMRIAIDLGHSERIFQILPRDLFVSRADVIDNFLVLRASKRVEVYDLTAPTGTPARIKTQDRPFLRETVLVGGSLAPAVMYVDDKNTLYLADGKGPDRMLDKFPLSVPLVTVAADGKRIAIASKNTLTLFDDGGRLVDKLTVRGDVTSFAWSPDLHTLAVATREGIDLWTFPR